MDGVSNPSLTISVHISVILNSPDAEVVEAVRAEVARLRGEGHAVHPQLTFEAGDARRMACAAAAGGADLVVAGGGDGTVNEVVNGFLDHLREGGGGGAPRLAILPLGTANDLATELGIPDEVSAALEVALSGREREMDVGEVEGRGFLNVSTGGIGAEATEEAPAEVKRALGPLAYLITGVKKFVALETSHARFVADEVIYEGSFLLFAVGNSRRTGGGNLLTPRADPGDRLLDVCVVPGMSRMEFLGLLADLRAGSHLEHPEVIYRQVEHVRVEARDELSVNVDGEPLSGHRFHYRLSPHRIRLMTP